MKILSPTAILGYGFPRESFARGLEKGPDLIAVDAGSTDPGPYYLGAGVSFTDRRAVKRDLEYMVEAAVDRGIPLMVGTAGGSGADAHLDWCAGIVREIARERKLKFALATISAEVEKEWAQEQLSHGNLKPLPPAPAAEKEEIELATGIVAQMGVEPLIAALAEGADVILAGRAYDPTVFAAPAIKNGFPPGLALHMGKILECASIAAEPGSGSDCMFGILREDHFILEPLNPSRRCTATSVAAHTLYEKENPYLLHGPGGLIDLRECQFSELDERRVKVTGSRFIPAEEYTLKLEGAKLVGYRTISIAGTRDPIMISRLDEIINAVREAVIDNFTGEVNPEEYWLLFRLYGKDAIM
ncbi:MAG: acyclic terpene utilization AtuA family protein, partial [Halanaerobium sp.]|nr:acyclic terpene utilization AtuA family protein [Halanaerobium sp.]